MKEFSQTISLFLKKAFQFQLLFYCLLFKVKLKAEGDWQILTRLTCAQPSHTHKNWTNREACTAYQKWSHISLRLYWISEWAFVYYFTNGIYQSRLQITASHQSNDQQILDFEGQKLGLVGHSLFLFSFFWRTRLVSWPAKPGPCPVKWPPYSQKLFAGLPMV